MCAGNPTPSDIIEVCAAVILNDGCLLMGQRLATGHLPGKWEFPGGKRHIGETLHECISRELREELGLEITGSKLLHTIEHVYPEKHVRLYFLACTMPPEQQPRNLEGQEHGWFNREQLSRLDVVPADIEFLGWLRQNLNKVEE